MGKRTRDDLSIIELLDKKLDKVYFFALMTVQVAIIVFVVSHNMRLERKIDILLSVNEEARKICDELNITNTLPSNTPSKDIPEQTGPIFVAILNKHEDKN